MILSKRIKEGEGVRCPINTRVPPPPKTPSHNHRRTNDLIPLPHPSPRTRPQKGVVTHTLDYPDPDDGT